MKRLTEQEINFIKDTGWTPTVQQCNEYKRTNKAPYYIDSFAEAQNIAREDFNIDLIELYDKTCNLENSDSISLEYDATYLLYTFFTKEELEKLTDEEVTQWLKDFKYFCGYRKWDGGNLVYVNEAIEIYEGTREFFDMNGDVWNREVEVNEKEN